MTLSRKKKVKESLKFKRGHLTKFPTVIPKKCHKWQKLGENLYICGAENDEDMVVLEIFVRFHISLLIVIILLELGFIAAVGYFVYIGIKYRDRLPWPWKMKRGSEE